MKGTKFKDEFVGLILKNREMPAYLYEVKPPTSTKPAFQGKCYNEHLATNVKFAV